MTTLISVTRNWQLEALLEIENPEFQHWYELGVWWAMYGEEQGKGPYDDQYLIVNLTGHIKAGWYDDPQKRVVAYTRLRTRNDTRRLFNASL